MSMKGPTKLDSENFIRHKLYEGQTSAWKRYAILVIGEPSLWKLLRFELITGLFGSVPGALGLALRKIFYPRLFARVGSGTVFGRNLVIRNAHRIELGSGVIIDDQALLDGRGGEESGIGIVIGDRSVINREVLLLAKVGSIRIGSNTDIGLRSTISSTGGVWIGDGVAIAGECKIGGGTAQRTESKADGPSQQKVSMGPITIADQCLLYMGAMVVDGVTMGRGSVVGAGAILQDDLAEETIVTQHQRLIRMHAHSAGGDAPRTAVDRSPAEPVAVADVAKGDADDVSAVHLELIRALDEPLRAHGLEPSAIADDFDLLESGVIDSMGFVDLIGKIEEALGAEIELDELDPEEHTKLGPLSRFLAQQISGGSRIG